MARCRRRLGTDVSALSAVPDRAANTPPDFEPYAIIDRGDSGLVALRIKDIELRS